MADPLAGVEEPEVAAAPAAPGEPRRSGGAAFVAAGILLSRLAGLVRQRVFGHYLGTSDAADAWTVANRIPNLLQNLLGEGVLSASFIPVYAALRARKTPEAEREARQVAGAVAGLLTLVLASVTIAGVLSAPWIIAAIAPGFHGAKRDLTVRLVQIFFPGIALLVLSAFCLGVLNSHHKFFLSYAAPVVMSAAVVVALVAGGTGARLPQFALAVWVTWGFVAGAALQIVVQLPTVARLLGNGFRLSLGRGNAGVAEVVRNFVPVVAGRGVVQVSAYVDMVIATLLPASAPAALAYAQTLYMLPISLFGMSISAASLPSMSAAHGEADLALAREKLRGELASGLRAIALPVVPTVIAFLALGDVAVAAVFQSGKFGPGDVRYVWLILGGSTVGLLAATLARLYSSTLYALRDARAPLRFAIARVVLTAVLGVGLGLWLPRALHLDPKLGAVGLTASAGIAGWIEFALLRSAVDRRLGETHLPAAFLAKLWGSAAFAGAVGVAVKLALARFPVPLHPALRAAIVFGAFALVYVGLTVLLRVPEAASALRRFRRRG